MTSTDELHKLLNERGVAYHSPTNRCTYVGTTKISEVNPGELDVFIIALTPEQAVAATLGSEREKALEELVRDMWDNFEHWNGPVGSEVEYVERMSALGIEVINR